MSSLASAWSDLKEVFFLSVAHAEEKDDDKPDEPEDEQVDEDDSGDKSKNKADDSSKKEFEDGEEENGKVEHEGEDGGEAEDGDDDDGDDDDDEDDEDDEDEDALVDPLDALREKYTKTVCHSFKHHFDECVERVTQQMEEPDYEDREYKEDCVEEFFHLQHCLNDHIAPVLFSKLK